MEDVMTEEQARDAIIANGYKITARSGRVTAEEGSGRAEWRYQRWTGVNYLDLAQTYKLHERPAKHK